MDEIHEGCEMFRVVICGVFGFMKRSQRRQSERTTRIVRTNTQHGSPIHSTRKVHVPDTQEVTLPPPKYNTTTKEDFTL